MPAQQPYNKNYYSLNLSAISFVLYPTASEPSNIYIQPGLKAKLSLIFIVYSNEI